MNDSFDVGYDYDVPTPAPELPMPANLTGPTPPVVPVAAPPPMPQPQPIIPPAFPGPGLPARPGPMPPRGIFSGGVPALGLGSEEISSGHLLGASVLFPVTGTIIGMKFGGMYGGLGGAVLAGSFINAYRAVKNALQGTESGDKEALVSGTYAVLGFAGAGYLIYRGLSTKTAKANENEDEGENEDDDDDGDDEPLRMVK